jgi:AcrR family transcriptional regulator
MTDGSLSVARRRRKEERPAEIIEAGLAEFGEKGFAAARIEDIAKRAGIAKGTVFRYFPTKEALFEAAIVSRLVPVFDQVGQALEGYDGPTLPIFAMLLDRVYGRIGQPGMVGLLRMILTEGTRFPAILEIYHRQSVTRALGLLRQLVARGVARGEFHANAVTELPMLLMAPAMMATVWRMSFEAIQPLPLEQIKAAHMAMITAVLREPVAPG